MCASTNSEQQKPKKVVPDFDKREGLLVAIIQDFETKDVLMQAYMNPEAYQKTFDLNLCNMIR